MSRWYVRRLQSCLLSTLTKLAVRKQEGLMPVRFSWVSHANYYHLSSSFFRVQLF